MAPTGNKLDSLRPNRFEGERIVLALAISVLLHVLIWGAYELNRHDHWSHRIPWLAARRLPMQPVQRYEEPVEFVTVETPSTEAPKNPRYISNHNSVAADDTQNRNLENPQLNGKSDMPDTKNESHLQLSKSFTGADQREINNSQASQQPKPSESSGDLTLGKPDNATTPQEPPRPRTLKEAYEQMAKRFPSMTMKQEGGALRHARMPSFAVKVTGFGDYDQRFTETVNENWWNLLASRSFALDREGKVVLLFQLNYDGSITQMRVAENTVGELLGYVCEKAVLDGAPYERWTEDMRLKLGDSIGVQYTFDYDDNF